MVSCVDVTYPENSPHSLRDILARVFGLTGSNGDHLYSAVAESGVDKSRPETSESSCRAFPNILFHRQPMFPVTEPSTVVVRSTTQHDNKANDEQAHDRDELDGGEYELSFSVNGHGEDVEAYDDDYDDGNPDRRTNPLLLIPEVDEDGGGGYLSAKGDSRLVPIVPANSLDC